MKKILTFALCLGAISSMSAQKATVDNAKKLAGKQDKIEEARSLIKEAMANDETANSAYTYYVAGKIEFEPNKKDLNKLAVEPNYEIDWNAFNNQLLNGYDYYMEAIELDKLPNEKGEVKPKYTKEMESTLKEFFPRYYEAGGHFYNNKQFYPEAYKAFVDFASMPEKITFKKNEMNVPDSLLAEAYFYAGIAAYSNPEPMYQEAADAFGAARKAHFNNSQAALYEIESWNNIMRLDPSREAEGLAITREICTDGFAQFGVEQPFFISRLVDLAINENDFDKAEAIINDALAQYPDNAHLYGLLGYMFDRKGDDAASEKAYRKAVILPGVDFDTMLFAVRKLYNTYVEKLNAQEKGAPELIEEYIVPAKEIAEKAKGVDPKNPRMSSLEDLIERIDYVMDAQL